MTEDRSNQPEMLSACQLCGSQLGEVELKSHLAANHFPLNCPTSSSSGASQIDHMQNGEPSHSKIFIDKSITNSLVIDLITTVCAAAAKVGLAKVSEELSKVGSITNWDQQSSIHNSTTSIVQVLNAQENSTDKPSKFDHDKIAEKPVRRWNFLNQLPIKHEKAVRNDGIMITRSISRSQTNKEGKLTKENCAENFIQITNINEREPVENKNSKMLMSSGFVNLRVAQSYKCAQCRKCFKGRCGLISHLHMHNARMVGGRKKLADVKIEELEIAEVI